MFRIATIMITFLILAQTSLASSLEEQQEALNVIANFADRMCTNIQLRGKGNNLELTGEAKAELKGIIAKITDLGFSGALKYQNKEYSGLLQKDLVSALENSTNCKLQIWNDLKDRLLLVEQEQSQESGSHEKTVKPKNYEEYLANCLQDCARNESIYRQFGMDRRFCEQGCIVAARFFYPEPAREPLRLR